MNAVFDQIEQELASVGKIDARQARWLSEQLDDELLGKESFSDEAFGVITGILSSKEKCSIPGIEAFITVVYSNFYKLSDRQIVWMLDVVRDNFQWYESEIFCLTVADLIARKYRPQIASDFFLSNAGRLTSAGEYAIRVGLEVSKMREREETEKGGTNEH